MTKTFLVVLLFLIFCALLPAQELGCGNGVCYCQSDIGILAYLQGYPSPCSPPAPLDCPADCDCPGNRGNRPDCPAFSAAIRKPPLVRPALEFSPVKKAPIMKAAYAGGQVTCYQICENDRWILCSQSCGIGPGTLNCPGDCGCPGSENNPNCQGQGVAQRNYSPIRKVKLVADLNCPGDCACPGNENNPACQPQQDPCKVPNSDVPCLILGNRGY